MPECLFLVAGILFKTSTTQHQHQQQKMNRDMHVGFQIEPIGLPLYTLFLLHVGNHRGFLAFVAHLSPHFPE